jgi:hypothetical protein
MRNTNLLFYQIDSFAPQQRQQAQMKQEIANMDGNRLLNTNVDDLVRYFADKFKIEAPQLHEERKVVDQQEAKRDVSGDPRARDRLYATGTEILMDVPFSGDPQMFGVKPSQWDTAPPRGIVKGNVIPFCKRG